MRFLSTEFSGGEEWKKNERGKAKAKGT
jgi:hypothetical protein